MNYIFLDIDGVLNNTSRMIKLYQRGSKRIDYHFDENSYKALGKICKKNKALVILTSSWRYGLAKGQNDELSKRLYELCDKYYICIHGWTTLEYKPRGEQIEEYILRYLKASDKFIVIDDETVDMEDIINSKYIYKTNSSIGLQRKDIRKINKMFKEIV